MILQTSGRIANFLRAALPPVVVLLFVGVMLRFPPARYGFYPVCPFHQLLGLQCPGCGGTRALAALLRGNLAEAMRFNALTTLLLPFAFAYGILCYCDFLKRRAIRPLQLPSAAIYSAIAVAIVFTVFRSLPVRSF
jgi:Protein of unknown function (DUF2752)